MQEYNNTDRQLHWLSQVLTKANRAYVPEQKDDSHTNLYFDTFGKRILGRWIEGPEGKIMLAFHLQSFSFQWLDTKQNILHEVSALDTKMEELEVSVSKYPESLDMRTEAFSRPLHFEIPDYKIDKLNEDDISDEGLKSWIYFRGLASSGSLAMLDYLQLESEICIWPHHFDSGIYTQVTADLGLGFGLAMQDTMIGQAYFYISGYRAESPFSYENLKQLNIGTWVSGEHWNGAVLPINALPNSSREEALKMIHTFIKETSTWFLNK